MASDAQINANKQNAQKSTGPTTPEGKARSCHNAVKTGLTGQTVLLPTDDVAAYQAHIQNVKKRYNPINEQEHYLVQSVIDTEWRLARIPALEAGIRAVGRHKLADLYPEIIDPATRAAYIDAEVQITYKKDLANLALQETRLRRHLKLDSEKLIQLAEPDPLQQDALAALAASYDACAKKGRTFDSSIFGLDFSPAEMEEISSVQKLKKHMMGFQDTLSDEEYATLLTRFASKPADKPSKH